MKTLSTSAGLQGDSDMAMQKDFADRHTCVANLLPMSLPGIASVYLYNYCTSTGYVPPMGALHYGF